MRPERESTSLYSGAPFSLGRILHPPFERLIGRVDSLQCWSFSVDDEWFCAPQGYRCLHFDWQRRLLHGAFHWESRLPDEELLRLALHAGLQDSCAQMPAA